MIKTNYCKFDTPDAPLNCQKSGCIPLALNSAVNPIYLIDFNTNFIEVNRQLCSKTGFDRNELLQMSSFDLRPKEVHEKTRKFVQRLREKKQLSTESFCLCKNGSVFPVEVSATVLQYEQEPLILVVLREISGPGTIPDSGYANSQLFENTEKLKENNREILKTNTALQELLEMERKKRRKQRTQIQSTIGRLVFPYIDKLSNIEMEERGKEYIKIIQSHLQTLADDFIRRLDDPAIGLTQKELLMANLVRQGKKSPEIAQLLGLTIRTVEVYRSEIRKKLKINNKRINLCRYLQKKFPI